MSARDGLMRSASRIIRVTPTLSTDAYAQGDVLFTATEIPSAVIGKGGCSKLKAMYVIDYSDQGDVDIHFIFSEGNTALGTINATADISDADVLANKVCGALAIIGDAAQTGTHLDNARIHQVLPVSGTNESAFAEQLLQASDDSTSVYVQAILPSSATPTYAANSLELILHIEY